ncbi:hypothetical protein C8P67_12810 [Flavobacterium aquicola]|uniref:Uncharacterized protein n=1 Tax=Flavobacterium aquicola TaxID=1682742 RepID=A0A3E0DY12_9FLAO|nr:hypothetical protein C8P67_12810 [Flavobacterium aquicola]
MVTHEKQALEVNTNEYRQPITATTTDLGNWLNGKLVLYLESFGKSEEWA